MKFIDRQEELSLLKKILDHDRETSSFVVVYGRRRLGKSTLLRKALRSNDVFYMAGDFIETVQLNLLKEQLVTKFPDIAGVNFSGWEQLLRLVNTLTKERFTLCLDEFPYMVKHSPELPSILQRLIDSKELNYNIVICGSSQRMMQKMVLSASEPLYGRANAILKLRPIPITYLQEVLDTGAIETVEEFSVWGGIPRYWELREEYDSLQEAIKETMLTSIGVLYDEPNRLFMDDLSSTVQSESLMSVIAAGAHRLSEIASRMGRETTALSGPLDRLIQMNYLSREIPFGESPKKAKRSLYKIKDPFMNFYYTFIIPNMSNIGRGRKNMVMESIQNKFQGYVSEFWEHLCREAVSGNQLFDNYWNEASRWWGSVKTDNGVIQMEIDLVAESIDGKSILLGECKWTNPEVAAGLIKELERKSSLLPWCNGKNIIPVLFLKHRPKDEINCGEIKILYPEDIIKL